MTHKLSLYLLLYFIPACLVSAQTSFSSEKHNFTLETLATGLKHPWSIEFLPDGRILMTERAGVLSVFDPAKRSLQRITGLPSIRAAGQGGLLDIAIDPDYANNRTIYISYSGPDAARFGTEVARARLLEDRLADVRIIFRLMPKTRGGRHFGSRLLFGDDGALYISTGDRGDRPRAQKLADHAGSLIRINPDGSIPEDNPFTGRAGVKPGIYTYGNRNIQGIAMHPRTREIWTVEHGPQGGDELNLMLPGVNYGWPVITYGRNYGTGTAIGEGTEKEGMRQPVHYWTPSIAISSLLFYSGDVFPGWRDNAFVSSLLYGQLARLEIKGHRVVKEERLLNGAVGRIREVQQGPDGLLYIITDDSNGKLIRLKPADLPAAGGLE